MTSAVHAPTRADGSLHAVDGAVKRLAQPGAKLPRARRGGGMLHR